MHGPLNVKPSRLLTHIYTWFHYKPTLTYGRLKDFTIPHIKGLNKLHNCPNVTYLLTYLLTYSMQQSPS